MKLALARKPPRGMAARLFRLPVLLYEHDFGWLLGRRMVEIVHGGRSTGKVYRSVVEALRVDELSGEIFVVSAWQGRTDWYRNIRAQPALEVRVGRERFVPEQRLLSAEETEGEMRQFARKHPLDFRLTAWMFGIDTQAGEALWTAQITDFFKGVCFRCPSQSRHRA